MCIRDSILGRMEAPVDEPANGGSGDIATGVGTPIINEDRFCFVGELHPSVRERHIRDVAEALATVRREKVAARPGDDL